MELIDKALDLKPDDYNYMDTKGWGLYKQGKFMEAREILQKSRDLSPSYSSHSIYLHLEAAKKAVANQKRADRKEISQWLNVKKVRPLPGLQQNKVKAL